MEKDKSPIQSTSVSLHSQTSGSGRATPLQGEPWNILICGDFGFSSETPHRVHISEWNDFLSRSRVILSGNVSDCLSGVDKPLFVEYPVDSIRDFSAPAVEERAALLTPFRDAIAALNDLLNGTIDSDKVRALIEKTALPPINKCALLGLLGKKASPALTPLLPKAPGNARIDSVLAMVDVPSHGEETGASAPVSDASSALFTAVAEGSVIKLPRQELQEQREHLEAAVKRQVEQIARAEFFSKRHASWYCLKQVAGSIGRTKGITVSVFSCSHDELADALAQALQSSSEQGLAPDIILIDDEYGFSNADISRLEIIANAASGLMCSVAVSVDSKDALFTDIESCDTLAQVFDDVRFIPYKKLRSNPLARCLALCGPRVTVGDKEPVVANAGWQFLFAWIDAFLSGQPLFDCTQGQAASEIPIASTVAVSLPIVKDAAAWGLTLFGSGMSAGVSIPVMTLLDEQAANPAYSCFGYNLAVNRIMKIVVRKVTAVRENSSAEELTEVVKSYLTKQLSSYDLLSSAEAVSVEVGDQNVLKITVDSARTVCGYPLYIQFSL
jgi:hypothetical protein